MPLHRHEQLALEVSVESAARPIPLMGELLFGLRELLTRRAEVAGYRVFAKTSCGPEEGRAPPHSGDRDWQVDRNPSNSSALRPDDPGIKYDELCPHARRWPVVPQAARAHAPRSSADLSDARFHFRCNPALRSRNTSDTHCPPNGNSRERLPLADSSPIGDLRDSSVRPIELHFFEQELPQ